MTRDRALAVIVLLIAGAIVVLVFSRHSSTKTVVHERTRTGPTLVVKGQALKPLQARRAKRTSAARSPDSTARAPQTSGQNRQGPPGARIRPSTPSRRKKTTGKTRKPSAGSGGGSPAAPAPPAQPAPRKPLVGVTVPAPVTVCAHPLATVNC